MADKMSRSEAQQALNAELKKAIADAISANNLTEASVVFDRLADRALKLATELDGVEKDRDSLREQLNAAGVETLDAELHKMAVEKRIAGLPWDDAVECARRQVAHDKRLAEAAAKRPETEETVETGTEKKPDPKLPAPPKGKGK